MEEVVLDILRFLSSMVKQSVFWGAILGAGISGAIGYRLARYNHKKTLERDELKDKKEAIRQKLSLLYELEYNLVVCQMIKQLPNAQSISVRIPLIFFHQRLDTMYQYGNIPQVGDKNISKELTDLLFTMKGINNTGGFSPYVQPNQVDVSTLETKLGELIETLKKEI